MPPWTERLLTKFKKLSSGVRRMNSRQQPGASASDYHDATSGYRLSRSRFVSAGRADFSQGAESFSNSQSVPDSCHDVKAGGPAQCAPALSSARSVNNLSDDSCLSLQRSSSAADSTASSDIQPAGGSAARRRTPKVRISDSSRVSDVKEVTAVLNQFAAGNHRLRQSIRLSDKPDCPAVQPEDLQQKQQQHQADEQEVSVPASSTLLPRRRLMLQAAAAEPLTATLVQLLDPEGEESRGPEQPLLLNNRRSEPPPTPRARASIAESTIAASPSPTLGRDARRIRRLSPHRQRQHRHQEQQELRVTRRPRTTPDAGFTRTIAFSVAREEDSDVEGYPDERRQRRDVRIASLSESASTPPAPSMTTTSSTTSTTMTTATSTATGSASPGRRGRRQRQQRLLRLRSANSVGSTPFVPTFSKIVKWSEAMDSGKL